MLTFVYSIRQDSKFILLHVSTQLSRHYLLGENIGSELLATGLGNDFVDLTPKAKATKAKANTVYIRLESSAQLRRPSAK